MIRRPALVLLVLTGLNLLNYVDRTVLAAVLAHVQDSLHLSESQGGFLATAFLVGYFATSPIFGALGDRGFSRRVLLTVGVVVWSAATWASGRASTFVEMLVARAVVGVGEASYAAVAPTIIDDIAPPERKGRWLSVFFLAIPVGSALGYLAGGAMDRAFGWRMSFQMVGGPGLMLALLCMLLEDKRRAAPRKKESPLAALRPLLGEPVYRRAVAGYCLFTFALGGFAHWAPKYIHTRYGTDLARANFVFGIVLVVAGLVGTGLGGAMGDRLARRARQALDEDTAAGPAGDLAAARGHLRVCAVAALIGAPFAAACILSPTENGFFGLILLAETALFLSTSPINASLLLSVPAGVRTSAMAISIFAIHVFGDLWSPPLVGALADRLPWRVAMLALPVAIAGAAAAWWMPLRSPPRDSARLPL
jgi:MFS family permease